MDRRRSKFENEPVGACSGGGSDNFVADWITETISGTVEGRQGWEAVFELFQTRRRTFSSSISLTLIREETHSGTGSRGHSVELTSGLPFADHNRFHTVHFPPNINHGDISSIFTT